MMIEVTFEKEDGHLLTTELPKEATLRDLQRELCSLFKKPFPKQLAKRVSVLEGDYCDQDDKPFMDVILDKVSAKVAFAENTTECYFYDMVHRTGPKATLAEEIAWEEECEKGLTNQSLKEWLASRRPLYLGATNFLPPWVIES